MRVALLSDVHANLPALEAALELARDSGADRIVVAGDLVGDGPFPTETVDRLMQEDAAIIRGNVDRKVIRQATEKTKKELQKMAARVSGPKANRAWTALQLGSGRVQWLTDLPRELELDLEGCRALVVHGSPVSDTDYIYPSLTSNGLRRKLGPTESPGLLVCGHSHVPFTKPLNGTIVVNCGSVGLPADGDPRGSLAMVTIEDGFPPRAKVIRFSYPVEEVLDAIRGRSIPVNEGNDYLRGVKG